MKRILLCLIAFSLTFGSAGAKKVRVYRAKGTAAGQEAPKPAAPAGEVKNLIFMIGDGMGLSHVSMMLIEGGYAPTAFSRMQNVALISTYSANNRVTDSAAAGTALASGSKTDNGKLGVTPDGNPVESMMAKAVRQQLPAGFVVTCKVQHATPGAFYAHVANRGQYDLISHQLADAGLDVVFGGGRTEMTAPDSTGTTAADKLERSGCRVIYDWKDAEDIRSGRVAGFFADDHMPPMLDGRGNYLPQAVRKALEILENNAEERGKGFMLMVEGSQIDFESHGNNTPSLLAEVRDFEEAVTAAMRFADHHPGTLVVVTADHETGGLSMPSGKTDFTASESGIDYRYGTTSHSGILVPVYLYGAGAERINGVTDNTGLAHKLMEIMGLK